MAGTLLRKMTSSVPSAGRFARHVIDAILDIFSEHISTSRLEVHSNIFDTNTESCPHISLAVHSTHLFDRSRTLQNSEEKPKSSEESWEQVAVPPEEAKLAETPGGGVENANAKSDDGTKASREAPFLVKDEPSRELSFLVMMMTMMMLICIQI